MLGFGERCVELGDELAPTASAQQMAGARLMLGLLTGGGSGREVPVELELVAPDSGAQAQRTDRLPSS